MRAETYKNASYPNAIPSWRKHPIHDPLRDYRKANGTCDTIQQAENQAYALRLAGNKTKIIQKRNYFEVYYKK